MDLAIDSNLALLLVVGRAERGLIQRHKRLSQFSEADYELLLGFLTVADRTITTPNALSEVSNLAPYGLFEPARSRVLQSLRDLIDEVEEQFVPSRTAAALDPFDRLGLTDCAWLAVLAKGAQLVTVDDALYREALELGLDAINFHYVRATREVL